MTPSIRSSILLGVLALVLLSGSALAGMLPGGPPRAVAAEGEETTTEEPPPVVETPTEPETTPEPETPVTAPPVTTPPVGAPSDEGGGAPVETPKQAPSTGSESSTGGGGGGGGSSSGSSGSSGGAATTSPATSTNRHPARVPTHTGGGGGGGNGGGGGGSTTGGGNGGSKTATGGGGGSSTGGGHRFPSHSGGGPAPQPTVSTQGIDEGASAVTNAASHVGEAFAEALPTAPLKKIGDRLAAHIAGADQAAGGGKGEKASAKGIGTAIGAALIGSAVAVDKKPVASSSPIPFFTPPGGKSSTIYLILIAALLLAVAALVYREVRKALGFDAPRTAVRVADVKPRIGTKERIGLALAGVQEGTHRWFSRFRRLRSNAVAGLRSLF